MPANSNIIKTINTPNRFGPQPGGGLMNRSAVVNPAQQANRPGPINSAYPPTSMPQRTAGGNPLMSRVNGRIATNVPSWNFTPGSSLTSQNISTRQQNFTSYPGAIHSVHSQQNDILDMSEFPALGSANTTSNNSSATGMSSSYANTAQTGTNTTLNDNRSIHHQQTSQEFTIDDFPALPGATNNSGNRGVVGSQPGVSQHHLVNHQQQNNVDGLSNGNTMSSDMSSSGIQDGRISNGGIRPSSQSQMNSVSEQDKKNFSTKSGGSVQIMQQNPSSSSSSMLAYSLTWPIPTTPYSTTSTLTGTPYPPSIGIPNLQSNVGGTPSLNQSSSSSSSVASADEFGLLGLLSVIRMTDPDLSMLALGSDLTTLGLNLNSPDALYATFTSPWAENNQVAGLIEPEYHLPSCYNVQPPPPAQSKIGSFSDETLFYIFYSMPRDILQEAAAQELYNRNWRYHKEHQFWLTKEFGTDPVAKTQSYERGNYIYFDPESWEKVKKEFVLVYDALEERPMLNSMSSISSMGGSSSSNLSSLAPTGLQQAVQQNLSVNSMNMSSLMGLSNNIPSGAGGAGASGLTANALAGLGGATPAQLQQLQQLHHPTIGPHHPLGPGLGQGGHYIAQSGLKDF
ncbi:CCR4-NOT core subunit CDC36 [Rhizophagus irregularis DAOM 197198w]|uniref:CCR4-NOT core subunit CDC36 n=1 Tax=Rhizophagus irregularis (strain DAOM 197198w) TaxID=1432141 RepID=A0A015K654_RHIIW|nr:CCR4-NOT core subunit CDC36 [Rhizophagus irregularis DAOM 197198w]EXX54908.1 CCR4-NOT core subunit CDC36 [Rhizophagus irregularis DAOM 197198w]